MKTEINRASMQPVSGMARSRLSVAVLSACMAALACAPAWANPSGPQTVNGQVTFSINGNVLTITNSPGAIINWQSFSINPGELTQFLQQSASSSVLNRIVGQNPSQILGALQSNGKVYLINPNGIIFGNGAQVNVAGLVASSLDISNSDFLAGKLKFNGTAQAGAVNNQAGGSITTPSGGQIYLIAPHVENSGIITSPQGEVLLAAGHSVQLVDGADPNLQVVVSSPADQALNLGQVIAQGGKIGIYGALVNQAGIVSADSAVVGQNGTIVFKASQTTTLSGNSQTTATGAGTGGTIALLGNQVGLTDNAQVDASGQTGGGTVLVGGDAHGANAAIQNATATYVGASTSIKADAIQSGKGGKVIVWSNDATRAYGSISVRGGAQGGNGGFVETSGHYLDVSGIQVSAGALNGIGGTWLLDPYDITIGTGTDTSAYTGSNPVTYSGTTSGSMLLASTVSNALNSGTSVIVDTSGAGSDSGNITVASAISASPSGTASLTLNANQDVLIHAPIMISGVGNTLSLTAGRNISQTAAISVDELSAVATSGSVNLTNASNAVNMISGSAGGSGGFNFVTDGGLTVSGGGISSSGDVGLQANTGINLSGGITAANSVVALFTSAGNILQDGAITASSVSAVAPNGSVDLYNESNLIGTIAGSASTGFDLEDNQSFTVGTVAAVGSIASVNGISSTSGGITLQTPYTGNITIAAPINAGSTFALINSAGAIEQGAGGLITASALTLDAGSGGIGSATPLLTNVAVLSGISSSGSVYISNSAAALEIDAVSAVGAVGIDSAGTLTIPTCTGDCGGNTISGSSVQLTSQGAMSIAPPGGGGSDTITATDGSIGLYAGYTNVQGGSLTPTSAATLAVTGDLSAANSIALWSGGSIANSGTSSPAAVLHANQYIPLSTTTPTLTDCASNPSAAGCSSVVNTQTPVIQASNTFITSINTSIDTLLSGTSQGGTSGSSGSAGTTNTNTGATNNGTAKKLYCN